MIAAAEQPQQEPSWADTPAQPSEQSESHAQKSPAVLLAVLGKQPQLAVQLALMTHCSNAVGGDAASAGSSSTHAAAIGAPMAPGRVSGACRAAVDGPLPGLGACRAAETALGGRAALQHRPNRQAARADPTTETPPPNFMN